MMIVVAAVVDSTGGCDEEVVPRRLQRGETGSEQGDQQQAGEQQQPGSPEETAGQGGEVPTGSAEGRIGCVEIRRRLICRYVNLYYEGDDVCLPD